MRINYECPSCGYKFQSLTWSIEEFDARFPDIAIEARDKAVEILNRIHKEDRECILCSDFGTQEGTIMVKETL